MTMLVCCASTVLWCFLIFWFGKNQNSLEPIFPGSQVWPVWRRSVISFFVLIFSSPLLVLFTMLLTEPIFAFLMFALEVAKGVVSQDAPDLGSFGN